MTPGHYENFPVASVLLPARLRRPVVTIYRFARTADDFADEGEHEAAQRLAWLSQYGAQLDRIERAETVTDPLFVELADVITTYRLPIQLFRDLLDAFSQDVVKTRYADFAELRDYSRRSADPVGRLLLHLFERADSETLRHSDEICSALQFINFWQDVALDFRKGRIYLPQDDMRRYAVTEMQIAAGRPSRQFRALMRYQIERTRTMLHHGAVLGKMLRGRIGLEIRLIVAGGDTILQRLLDADCDVFNHRPILRRRDWLRMLSRAILSDGRIAA
jgi:squalene synthase HpnC